MSYIHVSLIIWIGVCCFLFTYKVQGQSGAMENYGVSYLESQGIIFRETINSVMEDSRGRLWISTGNGVWIYDGYELTAFDSDSKGNRILSSHIKEIVEDQSGVIWIATIGGGLYAYDWLDDRITTFLNKEAHSPLQSNDINTISIDQDNNIWIGYRWGGLDILNTETHNISSVFSNHDLVRDISEILVTKSKVFIGTWRSGLFIFDPMTSTLSGVSLGGNSVVENSPITSLYMDDAGSIWVGNRSALVYKLNEEGVTEGKFTCIQVSNRGIPHVNDFIEMDDNLYVITSVGMYVKSISQNDELMVVNDQLLSQLLISGAYDTYSNIWIGTSSGLLKLSPNLFEMSRIKGGDNWNITSVEVKSRDQIFLGTWNDGLYISSSNTENSFDHLSIVDRIDLEGDYQVYCLMDMGDGMLIGIKEQGIYKYEYASNRIVENWSKEIGDKSVTKILQLDAEHFLVGTLDGIFLVDSLGELVTYVHPSVGSLGNNLDVQVTEMLKTKDGNVWVGTLLSGLLKISFKADFKDYEVTSYTYSIHNHKSISEDYISSLFEDKQGTLWVGTRNKGINKFDSEKEEFKRYSSSTGLASSRTVAIIEDSAQRLWVLGEASISRYNRDQDVFIGYSQNEGENFNRPCCQEAIASTYYDELIFGSNNGLMLFDPFKVVRKHTPHVYINNITLVTSNKEENTSAFSSQENKPIWSTDRIDITHNVKSITLELRSPNLMDSKSVEFEYMLEGFDDEWTSANNNRRFVTISNLPSGNYTLHYRAISRDSAESTVSKLEIIQLAPFWLTTWAYLLYAVLFVVLIILVRKAVLYKLSLENKIEIERLVRNKENEVNELRLKLFTDISHELRTPLTLVMGPLERLVSKTKYIGNDEVTDDLLVIQRNTSKILEMIQNVMNVNRPENYKSSYHPTLSDVVSFTHDLAKQYVYLAEDKKIKFSFATFIDRYELNFDRDKLDRVLTNLISNAFKYTSENETVIVEVFMNEPRYISSDVVSVKGSGMSSFQSNDTICVGVFNSGSAIPKEEHEEIFIRHYRGSETDSQEGYGIGLSIVKELLEIQHANVTVSSQEEIGTCFCISLPTFLDDNETATKAHSTKLETFFDPLNNVSKDQIKRKSELPSLVLIEDDLDLLNFIRSIFIKDYRVNVFSNGEDGLNFVFNEVPDIVICDLMLPSKSGFEVCEEIKKDIRTCHIPVIILTALATRERELEGLEYGADVFIAKPFSTKYLLTKIQSILKIRKQIYSKVPTDFILESKKGSKNSTNKKFLDKLNDEILENISNSELRIEELSQKMGLSRVHLFRRIKDVTGMSPTEYIRSVRLKHASLKLLEGNQNISQIAYDHGFSTPNYFSICFKKQFGTSPREFIENATK